MHTFSKMASNVGTKLQTKEVSSMKVFNPIGGLNEILPGLAAKERYHDDVTDGGTVLDTGNCARAGGRANRHSNFQQPLEYY